MFVATRLEGAALQWECGARRTFALLPYGLLALSVVLSMVQPHRSWEHQLGTLGLAAATAVLLIATLKLAPMWWHAHPFAAAGYFTALMALSIFLVTRESLFFIFALIGFFHAFLLTPRVLAVVGVGATSFVVNVLTGGFDISAVDWYSLVPILVIQTAAISAGTIATMKMAEQSEQRRKAVAELEAAVEENAGLHAQLLNQAREAGVQDERQRMAREIHDTLAQGLTGIVTQLQAAKRAEDRPEEWQRHLDTAVELARESLSEARRSVHAVRPQALESSRLGDALSEVAGRWSRINRIPADVVTTGTARPMHPEVEVTLLRATQEALTNVVKHANASRVGLTLSYMEDLVRLDVRDDGVGFEPVCVGTNGHADSGFGLTAMRQRVSRLAGKLEIESEPGFGTAISASVPAILPGGAE